MKTVTIIIEKMSDLKNQPGEEAEQSTGMDTPAPVEKVPSHTPAEAIARSVGAKVKHGVGVPYRTDNLPPDFFKDMGEYLDEQGPFMAATAELKDNFSLELEPLLRYFRKPGDFIETTLPFFNPEAEGDDKIQMMEGILFLDKSGSSLKFMPNPQSGVSSIHGRGDLGNHRLHHMVMLNQIKSLGFHKVNVPSAHLEQLKKGLISHYRRTSEMDGKNARSDEARGFRF